MSLNSTHWTFKSSSKRNKYCDFYFCNNSFGLTPNTMTSSSSRGAIWGCMPDIYFIMNMYEWKICRVLNANTRIHQHNADRGKMFKKLCVPRVYYSGSQTCGGWDCTEGMSCCMVKLEVDTLFISVRTLLAKKDLPPLALANPISFIQQTPCISHPSFFSKKGVGGEQRK